MSVQPLGPLQIQTNTAATGAPSQAVPPGPSAASGSNQAAAPTLPQITQAVAAINKAMRAQSQNVEFSIDTDSKQTVVKVVDQDSGEILRQIPSVEVLQIAKALDRITGLLIRQKA